ncbi:MAG: spermine/spermidine synthase domain-containing protein [Syntrophales bacterium]
MAAQLSIRSIQVSVFFISAALISYQILLFKMFSIQYWYHFAYLIISIALLGFGASGTFIFLFRRTLKDHVTLILFFCSLLFILSIWLNIYLNRMIAFNPLMIVWDKSEILRLLYLSLSLFIPFFLGALCIGVSFVAASNYIHRIYFANLAGSGLGSLIVLLTFFHIGPYAIMFAITLIAILAALGGSTTRVRQGIVLVAGVAAILIYVFMFRSLPLPMSNFKELSQAENLTAARKELALFGPLGLVTVLDSPAYHYLPDLSLNCPYPLPRQKGLFLDGNTVGAINEFSGNLNDIRFMDCRTNSVAYKILNHPDVLIIGGGSGTEILNATYQKAKSVSVVELNRDIIHLLQGPYKTFSGDIYRSPDIHAFIEEGRGYLQRTAERFDLIEISLIESMGAASAGVYSLNENYLFTTEAIRLCMERLRPEGILSISTWIKNPPRDNIKLLAMAIEAVKHGAKNAPAQSIVVIRSWQTATLLVKNGNFLDKETETIKEFCKAHLFDISYYPGVKEKETNIFNKFEGDPFYSAAVSLLSKERDKFYDAYPYYIRPATDDRPFFSHFFKIEMLKEYLRSSNRALIPFLDWGYILVWITACVVFFLGMIFIVAPMPFIIPSCRGLASIISYFGSLGLAYMFLEISVLQQFIRYLYDPIFAASVVIGSFLVYSGVGSLIAENVSPIKSRHIFWSVLAIGLVCIMFITSDQWLHSILAGLPLWLRMILCSLLIAPLAIPMGIPFPSGLSALSTEGGGFIAWAWSINGFFSVIGSSATVLIAISWGFKSTMMIAVLLYAVAAFTFARLLKIVPSLGERD